MHNYWWYWHFDDRTEIWFWLNLFRIIEHYYPKYTKLDKLYFQIIFPTYISNFKRIYTPILVGQIWWLKIGDGFWMSGTVIYVKRLSTKRFKIVIIISTLSPTYFVSKIRHRHSCSQKLIILILMVNGIMLI